MSAITTELERAEQYITTGLEVFPKAVLWQAAQNVLSKKKRVERVSWDDIEQWIKRGEDVNGRVLKAIQKPGFLATCREWVAYRQSLKKPLKLVSLCKHIDMLAYFEHKRPGCAKVVVDYTIERGWQGMSTLDRIPEERFEDVSRNDADVLREVLK